MSEAIADGARASGAPACHLCDSDISVGECPECGEPICDGCGEECQGFSCHGTRFCPDCARICDSEECDDVICEDCQEACHECESPICTGCGKVCPDCDQWYCSSCVTYCDDCGDPVCFAYCYDTHAGENGCDFPPE